MEPRDASDIDGQNREVEWHAVLAGIFSRGKTGCSSRDSMYCPANCRALSSNNGSSARSATRLTALASFAITSPNIVCCNFCKGLFLKDSWCLIDREYGKENRFVICDRS